MNDKINARESSDVIQRLYIAMRHISNRGYYKPMGDSGATLRESLLTLKPEIYGSIAGKQVELKGLKYVLDRLPEGIEECTDINLIADEGYRDGDFPVIIPAKRRRNCYRTDSRRMLIEVTRGRSEIYDILTHLTFLYIESHKIKNKVRPDKDAPAIKEWKYLEDFVLNNRKPGEKERKVLLVNLSLILGRTYRELRETYGNFSTGEQPDRFAHIIYWLGKRAIDETENPELKRIINFSDKLIDSIGHHIYGEKWANKIKKVLLTHKLLHRPLHIISANMHSVMNMIYAGEALKEQVPAPGSDPFALFKILSEDENEALRKKVKEYAATNGLIYIKDQSGTNINVQIIDTAKIPGKHRYSRFDDHTAPVLIVMDYAFGEQAYETMDELLKPYSHGKKTDYLNVVSISIMGKAGILKGNKGDIMIPTAHIFEGTADNYPFKNQLHKSDFAGSGIKVIKGTMVTVLGTSLQNKDLLQFFRDSTWRVIGLEMEGAHYQKAIQAAARIRRNISRKVKVRYAYYASDNPLKTGSTLASGGLGTKGVAPTYTITEKILDQIFEDPD